MPHDALVARLRAAGCVFAEDEARLLVAAATSARELERLVAARVGGAPLELLLGYAELCGLRVAVAPGVFVPRQRTALLVEEATALLAPGAVVLDLCCGTGAIAAVLARRGADHGLDLEVWAADLDPDAVACARRNLPPERVLEGDLFTALPDHLRGRVDVLTCNAPYVPSDAIASMPPEARDHEHRVALDGGPEGLDLHTRVAASVTDWLAPGGTVLIESSDRQAEATAGLLLDAGLAVRVVSDEETGGIAVLGRTAR